MKSVHEINNFLNCGGAGSIIDNSPPKGDTGLVGLIGSLSIGSIKQKPALSIGSIAAEPWLVKMNINEPISLVDGI